MKIQISNPNLIDEERTYLTADYSSGTTLTVRNSEGFTTSWYAIVGEPGQEQTEATVISATPSDTTITISALKFSHPKSTPVYLSQWNQVSFERKPSGGSYSVISGSPSNVEWDDKDNTSLIVVSGGATTDTYKWRFYNSTLGTYSDYSDELGGTGLDRDTVGHVIQQVRKNPVAKNIEDETLIDYMNEYQVLVYDEIPKAWWFSKEGTAVSTAASTRDYSISTNWSDLLSVKYILYRYINGNTDVTYPLTWSPTAEFYNLQSDANQAEDNYARYWTLKPPASGHSKGYISIHPIPEDTTCYIKPVYFFELTDLDSFADTLVVPYPKGYIDYVFYRIYDDIKNDSGADRYNARVQRSILALKKRSKRQLGQPEFYRYRGQRGFSQMFGEQSRISSTEARENYW